MNPTTSTSSQPVLPGGSIARWKPWDSSDDIPSISRGSSDGRPERDHMGQSGFRSFGTGSGSFDRRRAFLFSELKPVAGQPQARAQLAQAPNRPAVGYQFSRAACRKAGLEGEIGRREQLQARQMAAGDRCDATCVAGAPLCPRLHRCERSGRGRCQPATRLAALSRRSPGPHIEGAAARPRRVRLRRRFVDAAAGVRRHTHDSDRAGARAGDRRHRNRLPGSRCPPSLPGRSATPQHPAAEVDPAALILE